MEATRVAYLWRRVAGGLCVLLGGAVMAFAQLNRSIVVILLSALLFWDSALRGHWATRQFLRGSSPNLRSPRIISHLPRRKAPATVLRCNSTLRPLPSTP